MGKKEGEPCSPEMQRGSTGGTGLTAHKHSFSKVGNRAPDEGRLALVAQQAGHSPSARSIQCWPQGVAGFVTEGRVAVSHHWGPWPGAVLPAERGEVAARPVSLGWALGVLGPPNPG